MVDDVHKLSEEDIKLRYITPAILNKGWLVNDITMETKVRLTDGKINLRGNLVARGKAKEYVEMMDVPFAFTKSAPLSMPRSTRRSLKSSRCLE